MSTEKDIRVESAPEVSVIIPAGRPQSAGKTIQSILGQSDFLERIEIVIVGASLEALKKEFAGNNICFVDLEEKLNPAATRIAGVEKARGSHFLFIDDDIELADDFFKFLMPHLHNMKYGGIGARLPGRKQTYFSRVTDYCNFWSQQTKESGERGWLYSAVLVIPANVYHDVGGFNPEFDVGEDVDLTTRIKKKGLSIHYIADLVAFHNHGRTNLTSSMEYFWQNGRLAKYQMQKSAQFRVFSLKRFLLGSIGGVYNMSRLNWKDSGVMTYYFPGIVLMYMIFNLSIEYHYQKYQKTNYTKNDEKRTWSQILSAYTQEYILIIILAVLFIYLLMQ